MTNVEDKTVPYELLVRFDADGNVQGAHYIKRRIVMLDGERLKDEIGPAMPVAHLDGKDAETVNSVLSGALSNHLVLMEQHDQAVRERDDARAEAIRAQKEHQHLKLNIEGVLHRHREEYNNRRKDLLKIHGDIAKLGEAVRAEQLAMHEERKALDAARAEFEAAKAALNWSEPASLDPIAVPEDKPPRSLVERVKAGKPKP